MRAAGKLAGVVNSSFRGGIPAVPLPEHLSTKARPIAGVLSDAPIDISSSCSSTVNKSCLESDDWEFAEGEVMSDVDEPVARVVFGGAPTLQEAKDATLELRTALDQAFLSNKSSGGPYVSYPEHHLESKACFTSDSNASVRNHAIQAFRLLNESTAAQTVVASIASDPNVWTAILQNDALVEFLHSQKTGAEFSGYHSPKHSENEISDEETETKNDFSNFFQDIKARLEEMMNSLSGFFQDLFVGPGAVDGSAKATSVPVDKVMGGSIMGLAIMVIIVAILRRG